MGNLCGFYNLWLHYCHIKLVKFKIIKDKHKKKRIINEKIINRFAANTWLRTKMEFSVEQKVEWLYAFDIHCNRYILLKYNDKRNEILK